MCNRPLHVKALLLTEKVTAPRLKTVKINGNKLLLNKTIPFNDLFVLNSLNVANHFIFKCQSVIKVKNGSASRFREKE